MSNYTHKHAIEKIKVALRKFDRNRTRSWTDVTHLEWELNTIIKNIKQDSE